MSTYTTVTAGNATFLATAPALGQIRVVNVGIKQVKLKLELVDGLADRLPAMISVIATLEHLDQLVDEVGVVGEAGEPVTHVLLLELLVVLGVVALGVLGEAGFLEVFVLSLLGELLRGENANGAGREAEDLGEKHCEGDCVS